MTPADIERIAHQVSTICPMVHPEDCDTLAREIAPLVQAAEQVLYSAHNGYGDTPCDQYCDACDSRLALAAALKPWGEEGKEP
jgi:hypothetical protein